MTTGRMQDDANRPEPPDEAAKTETNKGPRRADMRKYNLGRGGRSRGEYPSGNPRDDRWWRLHEGVGEGALFDEDPEETPSLVTGGGEWAHGGKRSPAWTGSEREQQSDPVGGEGRRRQEMGAMLRRGVLQRSQQSPFFEAGTQGMWTGNMADALSNVDWGNLGMWASGVVGGIGGTNLWNDRRIRKEQTVVHPRDTDDPRPPIFPAHSSEPRYRPRSQG